MVEGVPHMPYFNLKDFPASQGGCLLLFLVETLLMPRIFVLVWRAVLLRSWSFRRWPVEKASLLLPKCMLPPFYVVQYHICQARYLACCMASKERNRARGRRCERKRGSANKANVIMLTTWLWVLTVWLFWSIYEVHDEAKDKAFELELSWVCDESNKQHQRVCLLPPGYLMSFCLVSQPCSISSGPVPL